MRNMYKYWSEKRGKNEFKTSLYTLTELIFAQSAKICSAKNLKITDPRKYIPFLNLLKMRIS